MGDEAHVNEKRPVWWDGYNAARREQDFESLSFQITKLNIQPGDFVVIRSRWPMSAEQIVELRERAQEQMPEGVSAMIITDKLNIAVLPKGTQFLFPE